MNLDLNDEIQKLEKLKSSMLSIMFSDSPFIAQIDSVLSSLRDKGISLKMRGAEKKMQVMYIYKEGREGLYEQQEKCFHTVFNAVCKHYDLDSKHMYEKIVKDRSKENLPKNMLHLYRYILKTKYSIPVSHIARLGNCHHASVCNSIKIIQRLKVSSKTHKDLAEILKIIDNE